MNFMIRQAGKFTPVMTIAGSDNSGGAGIQADLKTFMAHNCYGLSAIAAITAQNTARFAAYESVSPDLLYNQIKCAIELAAPVSFKTGMLATPENVRIVCKAMKKFNLQRLVIDPVLKSSTGADLKNDDYLETLQNLLIPRAYIITPNKTEAELLTGIKIKSYDDVQKCAKLIYEMGAQNVVIKGGHLEFDVKESVDTLYDGKTWVNFKAEKLDTGSGSFHGTGCTFSAALCANIAGDFELETAVRKAKMYTLKTMTGRLPGLPPGILNHQVEIQD